MGSKKDKVTPPEAPGADTAPAPADTPNRKKRFSFYKDGKDFVLLSVQRDDQGQPVPGGALVAIPDTPRFDSSQEAKRWVHQSGEKLAGVTVIIVKMCHKLLVAVVSKPEITVTEDTRFQKEDLPEPVAAAAG